MQTPHEAAVVRLRELPRADHPEIEELLAVLREFPVQIQRACETTLKSSGYVDLLDPIKAVADQQAVQLQELLDALTAPPTVLPGPVLREQLLDGRAARLAMEGEGEPLDPTQPATPGTTTLPKHPGDPDPNLPPPGIFKIDDEFKGLPEPFTHSGLTPDPESGRSGLDTSAAAASLVDPASLSEALATDRLVRDEKVDRPYF